MAARCPLPLPLPVVAAVLATACDPNFTVAHGDLGPARIAGLGVTLGADGERVAAAALWSGLGLYHEAPPTLRWTLDGQDLGEGYDVVVPGSGQLGLEATVAGGQALSAVVTVASPPPATALTRYGVDLGEDLSLTARRAAAATEVADTVEGGQAARLSLSFLSDAAAAYSTSWLLSEGRGTALEVDDTSADVLAEEITWDEGEVEQRLPVDAGLFHSLALIRDGAGSGAWVWADAAIGAPGSWLRHEGRLLALDQPDAAEVAAAASAAGWALVTLAESDDEAGLKVSDAVAAPEVDGQPDLSSADRLACAPADAPFRLAWIAEGRCPRPDVIGAAVLLEVW